MIFGTDHLKLLTLMVLWVNFQDQQTKLEDHYCKSPAMNN